MRGAEGRCRGDGDGGHGPRGRRARRRSGVRAIDRARTASTIREESGAGNRIGGEKRRNAENRIVSRQLDAWARALARAAGGPAGQSLPGSARMAGAVNRPQRARRAKRCNRWAADEARRVRSRVPRSTHTASRCADRDRVAAASTAARVPDRKGARTVPEPAKRRCANADASVGGAASPALRRRVRPARAARTPASSARTTRVARSIRHTRDSLGRASGAALRSSPACSRSG